MRLGRKLSVAMVAAAVLVVVKFQLRPDPLAR
jgi:hypothetical protein